MGYFESDNTGTGAFDFNADQYEQKNQQLANRIEDLTKTFFIQTKAKFAPYDNHVTARSDDCYLKGAVSTISGIPWVTVDAGTELKYREVYSNQYPTTIIDSDKLKKLRAYVRDGRYPVYIIWRFRDQDMYYEIFLEDDFQDVRLGRNTKTTEDSLIELKPQTHIPMHYLRVCTRDMFNREKQNEKR